MPATADDFARALEAMGQQLEGQVLAGARELAEQVRDRAAERTPVKTGRLRRGWQVLQTSPSTYRVDNPVEYAEQVELGTQQAPGDHMLGSAVAAVRATNA